MSDIIIGRKAEQEILRQRFAQLREYLRSIK